MNEISMVFGPDRHLSGTLSLPAGDAKPRLGVVLLNAGVIHRIGPHRFNVKLARALAGAGVPCLRIDLSTQGDSGSPKQPLSFEAQSVADLRAAMDHLQRICSVDRFVIAGICSGAFNGLAAALEDERVAGLWMLDGYVYPGPRTNRVRYRRQLEAAPLATLLSWARSAVRGAWQAVKSRVRSPQTPTKVDYGHRTPPRDEFARQLQTLVDRGTALYIAYTGSLLWRYNYPEQFNDVFGHHAFASKIRCDHLPDIDHTASTRHAQVLLIERLQAWIKALA